MNDKYIDINTYEIIENPSFFVVDNQIAKTISVLNKKGYKTLFSCSGHNENKCNKVRCDISLLENAKNEPGIYIGKIDKSYFEFYEDLIATQVYIKFDKCYNFKNIPYGFDYEKSENDGDIISKIIYLFENNKKRKDEDINLDISNANETLLSWANKLPNNKY